MQPPPPAHARSLSSEMLAAGGSSLSISATAAPPLPLLPLNATTTPSSITTPPSLRSLLPPSSPLLREGNHSLDVPQGDQPPVPPIKEAPPYRPGHWDKSTHRILYMQNRYGRYLEMWPNGSTQGVSENNSFCVFVMMSHLWNVVLKGLISDRFLCMNTTSYRLYTRMDVHPDCYIQEAMRNGSGHNVYSFANCSTPQGKKCYLGIFRNGTMRRGVEARQSQNTAQWLTKPVPPEEQKKARDEKEMIHKQGGWDPPPRPVFTTPRPVSPREQRRKRVRRWCRNLDIIVKKPRKFLRRCKHDCPVLKKMLENPDRSMRRCLLNHVRRRHRKKGQRPSSDPERDSKKIRARVQSLWPKRKEIFRRLRLLHRCNKKLRRGGRKGAKRRSCTKSELQRQQKLRAQKRKLAKASSSPSSPSSSSSSQTHPRPRRPRLPSRQRRRRIRHQRKRAGVRKRERGQAAAAATTAQPEVRREKRRSLWTALTSR